MISMQEIFKFRRLGRDADGLIQGQLETTGVRPKFMEMFASRGIRIPPEIFVPGRVSQ